MHAVVVRNVRRAGDRELDDGEDTRVRCVPLAEVRRMVVAGEIDSATNVSPPALFFWKRDAAEAGG